MAKTYTMDGLASLSPQWEEVFGEHDVDGIRSRAGAGAGHRALHSGEVARAPLAEYVATLLPAGTSY